MTQDPKIYAAGHRGMMGSAIVSQLLTQGQPAARAVTRKITQGLADIAQGLKSTLYIGNLDALRNWGHAKDNVRMQWIMLQQDQPADFVIATGVQYSVRQFIQLSAQELGTSLRFEVQGGDEVAIVDEIEGDTPPHFTRARSSSVLTPAISAPPKMKPSSATPARPSRNMAGCLKSRYDRCAVKWSLATYRKLSAMPCSRLTANG